MTILLALWGKAKGWVIALGTVMALLAAAYAKGRTDQKSIDQSKDLKGRLDAVKKAREVSDEVHKMSPADLDRELDRWMRD